MRVLVAGGAGYIGSHAARALRRRGHEVVIYDNLCAGHASFARDFELIVADISDSAQLSVVLQRVDAVMHFAAHACVGESIAQPRKYFHNNVQDGLSLLHAVLDSPVRKFVFSSTCAVYGNAAEVPIRENAPCLPVNPYGATKLLLERALKAYHAAYGLRSVSLRYFNAAGADESSEIGELHNPETHLIPSAFEAIAGRRPALEIFGSDYATRDGTCVRDYIHVSDLAEAHAQALEYLASGPSIALNLGTGQGYSVLEILSAIERLTRQKVPRCLGLRREGDPVELVADPARAHEILGWQAERSLAQMVSTAWNWHQRQVCERAAA